MDDNIGREPGTVCWRNVHNSLEEVSPEESVHNSLEEVSLEQSAAAGSGEHLTIVGRTGNMR